LNLSAGIANSVDAKLQAVIRDIDDSRENNDAAINVMYAFINEVRAQLGKRLNDAQADYLISAAEKIIVALVDQDIVRLLGSRLFRNHFLPFYQLAKEANALMKQGTTGTGPFAAGFGTQSRKCVWNTFGKMSQTSVARLYLR
jgi:hypothetical protein